MIHPVSANYFDGKTSLAHPTMIELDEGSKEIRFSLGYGFPVVWKLADLSFARYDDVVELRNKQFPAELLKLENKAFGDRFYEIMLENSRLDVHTRMVNIGGPVITAIAVVLLGLVTLAYFYVLPGIAEKTAYLIPESVDTQIGDLFAETYLNEQKTDSLKSVRLGEFASLLNLKNKKTLRFSVVESDVVNAFALPNGQIVVHSAIIEKIDTAEELAALLGHEASHINQRHSIKMLSRNLAGYLVISLLLSDVNGVMAVLADNAQQLHSLSYSRKFEQEADEEGLRILIDNHLDPNGVVSLFEMLENESKIRVPRFISTHPLTSERKENMKRLIATAPVQARSNERLNNAFESLKK